MFLSVSMDKDKNVTYQIYDNEEEYKKTTSSCKYMILSSLHYSSRGTNKSVS